MSEAPAQVPEYPVQVPESPVAPPPPPAPGASGYEWRAYRHQMRGYVRSQQRTGGGYGPWRGGLLLATGLILAGGYYLLRNLGALPWLNEDVFWPILLILLGLVLLARRAYPQT